jgi:hypothetical protein
MFFAGVFPNYIEAIFCLVRFLHEIEAVFLPGSWGFLWVQIVGSQNFMASGYVSNISAVCVYHAPIGCSSCTLRCWSPSSRLDTSVVP